MTVVSRQSSDVRLTKVQREMLQWVLDYFDGALDAQILLVGYDPGRGREMALVGTNSAALLHYGAGMLLLRRALYLIADQPYWHDRDKIIEALRTALPFLEAIKVAEPAGATGVEQ